MLRLAARQKYGNAKKKRKGSKRPPRLRDKQPTANLQRKRNGGVRRSSEKKRNKSEINEEEKTMRAPKRMTDLRKLTS